MRLLLPQTKVFYDALNHGDDYTVVHCQDVQKNKFVGRKIVKGWAEFSKTVEQFNGNGNVFCSRNPTDEKGKTIAIKNLTFDLDPEEYDKTIGSSKEQMEACQRAGMAILAAYPFGWLSFSGNGCLVGLPFTLPPSSDIESFPESFKLWSEKYVKPIIKTIPGVRLDELYDNERLIKVVGTVSCRGERRYSRFLSFPTTNASIHRLYDEFDQLKNQVSHSCSSGSISFTPNSVVKSLIGHPNRQRYLVSLAGSLHRRGLSEDVIFETVKKAYQENCVIEPIKTDSKLLELVQSIMKYDNKEGLQNYGALLIDEGTFEESTMEGDLAKYAIHLSERGKFKKPELSTGFKTLDDLTNGYQRGDIFTIGAYTGGGKSTFLVNSADALCKNGKRVLFLSTEMSKFSIFNKFFSLNTEIDFIVYDKGNFNPEQTVKKENFKEEFKNYSLVVNDSLTLTTDSVRLLVQKAKPDVLIFDHIHEVGNGSNNYYGFLKDFTHGLQLIARDFNCAVVLAAQFQRPPRMLDSTTGQYKKPPKPTTQSIKACGDIENKSRVVALLSDTFSSLYSDINIMELEIAKCSKGSKGVINLGWQWKKSKFEERK